MGKLCVLIYVDFYYCNGFVYCGSNFVEIWFYFFIWCVLFGVKVYEYDFVGCYDFFEIDLGYVFGSNGRCCFW